MHLFQSSFGGIRPTVRCNLFRYLNYTVLACIHAHVYDFVLNLTNSINAMSEYSIGGSRRFDVARAWPLAHCCLTKSANIAGGGDASPASPIVEPPLVVGKFWG